MDAKENARRIIRFAQPERVVSGPPVHDCSYFGVNHEPFAGAGGHEAAVGTFWRDIWGVGWRKELEGVMGYAVEHPLADLRLDRFAWPSADDPRICSVIPARAAAKPAGVFLCGSHRETLWERA
ncbi:MAG: hypothetical protein N3A66_10555, partial [Planctomycetota bacterium]|nr:hypothetical protein [Planctomycetota bacterium]